MVRKCCVPGCKSNYISNKEKVSVYRLPADPEERKRWMEAIPRDSIPDNRNTVVCSKHFPPGFAVLKKKGKARPKEPPSVFEKVSETPSKNHQKKKSTVASTNNNSRSQRQSALHDAASTLLTLHTNDYITSFQILCAELSCKFNFNVVSFMFSDELIVQSKEYFKNTGIPKYSLKVKQDFTYTAYHMGIQCELDMLKNNKLELSLRKWSAIEKTLKFLDSIEVDINNHFLLQQIKKMSSGRT